MKRLLIIAILLFPCVARAQFPAMDIYGGLTGAASPGGATGFFRTERINSGKGRWAMVDPLGNYVWLSSVYAVTIADAGSNYPFGSKYTNGAQWASFQLYRMQQYGMNAIGAYSSTGSQNVYPLQSYGSAAASPKLPFLYSPRPADLCLRSTTANPLSPTAVKNLYNGMNASVYSTSRALVDMFDPAFATCISDIVAATGNQSATYGGGFNGGISTTEPYLIGFWIDDTDNLFGFRFGTPFIGWIAALTNPYQNSTLYSDINVYSKQNFSTFLQAKYGTGSGGLTALNSSWGSNYTSWTSTSFAWTGANADTGLVTGNNTIGTYSNVALTHPGVTASSVTIKARPANTYTLVASDNFTRANENPLSDGGKWSAVSPYPALQIVSGLAEGTSTSAGGGMYWSGNTFGNDQACKVTVNGASSANDFFSCLVRVSGSTTSSWYNCNFFGPIGTAGAVQIQYYQGGTFNTALGSGGTVTLAANDVLECDAVGTTINAIQNGTILATATDSRLTSGSVGLALGFYPGSAGALTELTAKNWEGDNVTVNSPAKIGQDDGSGNLNGTGCVGSPCISSGTINYTTGLFSVVLASNLPTSAQLSAEYTGNAWPKGTTSGTGVYDEDGTSSWVPNSALTGGSAAMLTDLTNYTFTMADKYFGTQRAQIKAQYPNHLIFGPGTLSPFTNQQIFAAAAKDLDVVEVSFGDLQSNTITGSVTAPCDAAIALGYSCKPQIEYLGIAAQPDSDTANGWGGPTNETFCSVLSGATNIDYSLQTLRGNCFAQSEERMWTATASNGVQPILGFEWWELADKVSGGENANFGLISQRDNPYGFGLDTNSGSCNETQNGVTKSDCTELATHTDFLTQVVNTQRTMFYNLILAAAGSSTTNGSKGRLP